MSFCDSVPFSVDTVTIYIPEGSASTSIVALLPSIDTVAGTGFPASELIATVEISDDADTVADVVAGLGDRVRAASSAATPAMPLRAAILKRRSPDESRS